MSALKISLLVVAGLSLCVLFFLYTMGVFIKVKGSEVKCPKQVLVYEEYRGDYKNVGKIQNKVYATLLESHGIETYKGFSIYYDNPKEVEKEKLRSLSGCILEAKDYGCIEELREAGLNIKVLEPSTKYSSQFPQKNGLSVLIGIMKVHPHLEDYAKQKGITSPIIMEIYDVPNEMIIYSLLAE